MAAPHEPLPASLSQTDAGKRQAGPDLPGPIAAPPPPSPVDNLSSLIDSSLRWIFGNEAAASPDIAPWLSDMENSGLGNPTALARIRQLSLQVSMAPTDRQSALDMIVEMRRLERAFLNAASHIDPLTGLRTRNGMMRTIEQEMARFQRSGTPFCVAVADLDRFKDINDRFGHNMGDRVLVATADEISGDLRTFDDAFRLGGEEFLICLKDVDPDDGQKTMERLRRNVETLAVDQGDGKPAIRFTISIGMACAAQEQNAEALVRKADEALYRAKALGRNRVVCDTLNETPAGFEGRPTFTGNS